MVSFLQDMVNWCGPGMTSATEYGQPRMVREWCLNAECGEHVTCGVGMDC